MCFHLLENQIIFVRTFRIDFSSFSVIFFSFGIKFLLTDHHFQPVITEINHAIGAEGFVSAECKQVVTQYGDLIWDLLVSGVGCFYIFNLLVILLSMYKSSFFLISTYYLHDLQVTPNKVCSQIGLCLFNRAR